MYDRALRIATAAIGISCLSAGGVQAAEGTVVRTFGIGREPCSTFLASPQNTFQGSVWILGYWTAMNVANPTDHTVGKSADSDKIIADVKKACAEEAGAPLYGAIGRVYGRFQKDGK